MPNWCFNDVTFFTDSKNFEQLKELHESIIFATTKFFKTENNFGACWLGNIAEYHNIAHDEIDCRGIMNELSKIEVDKSIYYFTMQAETAWTPVPELWDSILSQYQNIEYVYLAEECGNGLYVNTDEERLFCQESFIASNFDDNAKDIIEKSELFCDDIDFEDYVNVTLRFETEVELINSFNVVLKNKVNCFSELIKLNDSENLEFAISKYESCFL